MLTARDNTPLLHRPYLATNKRPPWYKDKFFYLNLVRRSLAEFLGTGLFVFTAVSALSGAEDRESVAIAAGLAQGLCYGALVAAMMHVSGGHFNPAVTLGVLLAGGINVVASLCYFLAQLVGGIVGAACVLAYDTGSNSSALEYGVTRLNSNLSPMQGILVELLLTFLLVTVFLHTTMEKTEMRPVAPVLIGLALTAAVISSHSLTGGSLNPARSLGPATVASRDHHNPWTHHYVYWVGPLIGGFLSGAFYRLILSSHPLIPITEPETVRTTG
jgi:MIP family channel proteins